MLLDEAGVISTASSILRNLLTSIPTFWGETELLLVIELYLDGSHASAPGGVDLSLLVKTVAKRASPNVLLPTLSNMWSRIQAQPAKFMAFIQVAKISVKAASRPAVLENLRELFKSFLSMFDVCATIETQEVSLIRTVVWSGLTHDKVESALINAFVEVVVKLNETAFRPIFRKMFDWAFASGMWCVLPFGDRHH